MTARTIPTLPTWTAGMRVTGANLALMVSYQQFFANRPMFRMRQSIAQTTTTGVDAQVTCDVSDYDTDSGRGGSTPWSYTIPAGLTARWRIGWAVVMESNATGARDAYIKVNGSRLTGPVAVGLQASNDYVQAFGTTVIPLNGGDVLSMWVWQNSGGNLNTRVSSNNVSVFEGVLESLASP